MYSLKLFCAWKKYSNIQNHLTSSQFCPGITFFVASLLLASVSRYTLLHGVLFPIEQKPPIHPLGQSQRCCGMSSWPLGYTARGGSQPRFVALLCLVLLCSGPGTFTVYSLQTSQEALPFTLKCENNSLHVPLNLLAGSQNLFVRPVLKFWFDFWFRNILKMKYSIVQLSGEWPKNYNSWLPVLVFCPTLPHSFPIMDTCLKSWHYKGIQKLSSQN